MHRLMHKPQQGAVCHTEPGAAVCTEQQCWRWMAAKTCCSSHREANKCKSESQPAPETATTPCRTRGERSNLAERNGVRTSSVVSAFASAANSDMIGDCVLLCWAPLPAVSSTGRCALVRIYAIFRSVLPLALSPPLQQISSRSTRISSACQFRAFSCVSNQLRIYLQAALSLECVLPLERLSPPQISRIRVLHEF